MLIINPRPIFCFCRRLAVVLAIVCGQARETSANEVIQVPFEFIRDAIVVQATIDGKGPFSVMLDTGVDPSVIDLETAKQIGLKLDPKGHEASGGGTDVNLTYETELPLLKLGGLTATKIKALAANLSQVGEGLGRPIQAVLGYSLLKNRIMQIDYPKRVVGFCSVSPIKSQGANSSKVSTLPFRYHDNILADGIVVNGKKLIGNFDTGSNGTFQLTSAAVAKLGLTSEVEQARVSKSTGFNGLTENREGKVRNVTIGAISVDQPSVVFFGKGTGRDDEGWDIRIGNALLKHFVFTVDYQNSRITLERP